MGLNMLPDDPGNQSHRHVPLLVNSRDHEAYLILLTRCPAVITAVSDGIDADGQPHKHGALLERQVGLVFCPFSFSALALHLA